MPVYTPAPERKGRAKRAAAASSNGPKAQDGNVQIFDTAGRQEIDKALIEEIKQLREFLQPQEVLLVADAATGQQAVSVATHFHEALGITGIVLTKLDGDARGGAALSMREVTQRPIKFAGVGEKLDQFEPFVPGPARGPHPRHGRHRRPGRKGRRGDRRGRGQAHGGEDAHRVVRPQRLPRPVQNDARNWARWKIILGMLPGMGNLKDFSVDEKQMKRVEAIVLSMTLAERTNPDILNARRRQRIARGSGVSVTEVNDLLQRFGQMRKMMKNVGKMKQMMAQMSQMKS